MPLKLIPPNKRGSPYWTIRGTPHKRGKQIERSTGTDNEETARKIFAGFLKDIADGKADELDKTFSFAAEAYKKWKNPKHYDIKRLDDICFIIGKMPCAEINQNTMVEVAHMLHAKSANSTINRNILVPIAAVVHYAAKNKWCPYVRFDGWKPPQQVNKTINPKDIKKLLVEARKPHRYFKKDKYRRIQKFKEFILIWFLKHGSRVTETLGVKGQHIDLKLKTFSIYRGKTSSFDIFDLDNEICEMLKELFPSGLPDGRIFPWQTKSGVYGWLVPMARKAGVKFTPHVGRHTVGTAFKAMGAPLKVTMNKLGHKSYKSSLRYQADDLTSVRLYSKKLKRISV